MSVASCVQVLCHIADRLADLHSAGYVHRDLKQSNVMWQPQCNRWTLIDFGLVTRIGQPAKIGFSLGYAAPEVVIAFRRGEPAVIASEAMDAWSLGVLAVELFTNDVGLDLMQGTETVCPSASRSILIFSERDPENSPCLLYTSPSPRD